MFRNIRYKILSSRYLSLISASWRRMRRRWYVANKSLWVVVIIAGLILFGFYFFIRSVFEYKDDRQNLACLALNVYYEARGEPEAGQYAVAEVTMNRVTSGRYSSTVCGVVYQRNWDWIRLRYVSAFSWTEFNEKPVITSREWARAWKVADAVYYGKHAPLANGALYYHSIYIHPSWADEKKPVALIGRHIFYK